MIRDVKATHFADDATLAHIAELERRCAELRKLMDEKARAFEWMQPQAMDEGNVPWLKWEVLMEDLYKQYHTSTGAPTPPVTPHRSMPGPSESSDSANAASLRQPCETGSGDMASAAPTTSEAQALVQRLRVWCASSYDCMAAADLIEHLSAEIAREVKNKKQFERDWLEACAEIAELRELMDETEAALDTIYRHVSQQPSALSTAIADTCEEMAEKYRAWKEKQG